MSEKKISKFLRKLFGILDNSQYQDIISWDGSGQSILIKDQLRMEADIIPVYFSLRKFSSFVRQLHLYNFHKEKSSNCVLVFRNSCFHRQHRKLAEQIVRKRKTKAQMLLTSQTKTSQKSLNSQSIFEELSQTPSPSPRKQQYIESQPSLSAIALKSYSKLEDIGQDPYDIFNFLEIL